MSELVPGTVEAGIRAELPELRLWTRALTLPEDVVGARRSAKGVREQLKALSDRIGGARAIQQRTEPIAHAHRVLFRHIGLDPDTTRTPAEALTLERLRAGGLTSHGPVPDALTIATAETGVGVWALDAERVAGTLTLREARAGETLGRAELASDAAPRNLVIADDDGPLTVLFGSPEAPHAPGRETRALLLYAVQVPHVPRIHVEEALYLAASVLDPALDG